MAQPSNLPEWATTDVTLPQAAIPNKAQPTENLRTVGFDLLTLPEAQEENYWRNLVFLWVSHFNDVIGTSTEIPEERAISTEEQAIAGTDNTTIMTPLRVSQAIAELSFLGLVGAPVPWPTATAPSGYLIMMGQAFDPVAFPELAVIYPTHFLPDLRGEFIRGWDNERGVNIGRTLLSAEADELKEHSHSVAFTRSASQASGSASFRFAVTENNTITGITGGSETRPRNVAFNYITRAA